MIENPASTIRTSVQSETSLNAASTTLPGLHATPSYEAVGRSAATSSAPSASVILSASALSRTAAAASSQALAGASSSANSGSEVSILAQIIIAIGVIPIELLIMAVVLGIHRLMHRRPSRPPQVEANGTNPTQDSLLYLQPKAELEDEQRRWHELHGEHTMRELDGEDEILQMPDETGRQKIHEMPESNNGCWETPLGGIHEVMGDEYAQELECSIHRYEQSIRAENTIELESSVGAKDQPMSSKSAQELASPGQPSESVGATARDQQMDTKNPHDSISAPSRKEVQERENRLTFGRKMWA